MPEKVLVSPRARRPLNAFCAVDVDTWYSSATSAIEGTRSPGAYTPARMRSSSWSVI
nr:hypothetical protein [Nocardiopsis sp. JB363]